MMFGQVLAAVIVLILWCSQLEAKNITTDIICGKYSNTVIIIHTNIKVLVHNRSKFCQCILQVVLHQS